MLFTAPSVSRVVTRDRRGKQRFPLAVDVEYTLNPGDKKPKSGRGVTVNLSATGILFQPDQPLPVGKHIRFSMAWPVLLAEEVGLRLVGTGRTVRVEGNHVAVHFLRWEFRTCPRRKSPYPARLVGGGNMHVFAAGNSPA